MVSRNVSTMELTALDAGRSALEAKLAAQARDVPPLLDTKMGDVYRSLAGLRATLTSGPNRAQAIDHIRALIERIVLHPAPEEPTGFVMDRGGLGWDPAAQPSKQKGHRAFAGRPFANKSGCGDRI